MERRKFVKTAAMGAAGLASGSAEIKIIPRRDARPNILWLVSEDNSPYLGCYGDEFATTPNLDKLATQGVRFTNAFANAPVCAPARCTIITGVHASSLGAQHMRSSVAIPDHIKFFTEYLRESGYYCTNKFKTDYNTPTRPEAWDECGPGASWKGRKKNQPFFHVVNFMSSHESSIHRGGPETKHDQATVPMAPYHPDTPEMRRDYARYYDQIEKMDGQVGKVLDHLEKDGLAENTVVFYFGDHGGVLPFSKRWLYDAGMKVPMIMRFPKKYRHLAPSGPGSTFDRLVSFVDLAPTMMSVTGLPVPEYMQGAAFLGPKKAPEPKYVFGFRGRMDSRYDFIRCVRDKKYKYIRNYTPHLPWFQHTDYMWKADSMKSWYRLYKQGKLSGAQLKFFMTKPYEELYDTEADPFELNNLAGDPSKRELQGRMDGALYEAMHKIRDTGFLHEAEMTIRAEGTTPYEMAHDLNRYDFTHIASMAKAATRGDLADIGIFKKFLSSPDSGVRYWSAMGCVILGTKARDAADALPGLLNDPSPSVRIAVADALCRIGDSGAALKLLTRELENQNVWVALQAANVLDFLDKQALPVMEQMKQARKPKSWHKVSFDIGCGPGIESLEKMAALSPVASVMERAVAELEGRDE